MKKYVCLEGIEHGNKFFSTHREGNDPTKSAKGDTWYRILGYADTVEEAQSIIYPLPGDSYKAMRDHLLNSRDDYITEDNVDDFMKRTGLG